ncbi:amino-acid N-acetyltransferase [Gilliamella apicola]|uniref:amino-acid N-acetyltransferase n=1 Tax=Gilliamella apicola TaxID=1196095 RepID=UPI000A3424CB|nr:amino-acid N-acetyltransferase [Gilliamella apicola]OTP90383.1 amino-acid N-acetyltransferase [Gilliamella apicola]OTP94450.1 amino-acid N-acetyltransferase [Gilliamella apicola]OTP96603.1 amino-acid N-acetyltransferase [Gilliamella apicola]OTQ02207.1 amino-acid N-acetyltransferase [Gilliamella apicola]OTQ05293.1 amino-acid N-acetyltransferase [Gilliamella apicola]
MKERTTELVEGLRHSVPYINAHHGKTFVILLTGAVLKSDNYSSIINDIGLLYSLGIKLVIVNGARNQIDVSLKNHNITPKYHKNTRITDSATLDVIKQVTGLLQLNITASLSMSLNNTPLQGAHISVVSGNFVIAQPLGVDDGVDYCHTGKIRRINNEAIEEQLERGSIVLLGPVGVSVTGESFNLASEDVAAEVAIRLKADKLISFCAEQGVLDENGRVITDLYPIDADNYVNNKEQQGKHLSSEARFLRAASKACRCGVRRSHLVSYLVDGSILQELFSRDGIGTQVSMEHSEQIRSATINDIGGILELIRPLEEQGVLVKRSREQLEMEIDKFTIIERDNMTIGCAALYPYLEEKMGEMACVVIHPDYRNSSRGDLLIEKIMESANNLGLEKIFVLTTRSIHWFREKGFNPAEVDDLPIKKKQLYNYQRNSKILMFNIE